MINIITGSATRDYLQQTDMSGWALAALCFILWFVTILLLCNKNKEYNRLNHKFFLLEVRFNKLKNSYYNGSNKHSEVL